MIDLRGRHIVLCGDIHGEFRELVFKLENFGIQDTDIIILGDCGFGFETYNYYTINLYQRISKKLERLGDRIYCIRGNHDDPEYYNGELRIDLERLKTVPDYETINTDAGLFLVIGGATSTDRIMRQEYDQKHSGKTTWWPSERPLKKEVFEIPKGLNGILSHTGPIQTDPVCQRYQDQDLESYQNSIKDRDYLGKILTELEPSYWFYGHFHQYHSGTWGKTLWHCLGIMELYELT